MAGWLAEVSGRRYPGGMGPAKPELVYDVGVCNGDDSAYYLHKACRVVGVEANPLLLEPLRRFQAEIRDGRALYCKIDIEGNDELCLDDMTDATAPQFVSVELMDAQRQIRRMQELGYARFKIISQRTLRPPGTALGFKRRLPKPLRSLFVSAEARLLRLNAEGTWTFPRGSSGPFGEDTPGKWQTADQALELGHLVGNDLSDWYDIHAAQPPR